jgi:periplasmic protein CpxP/Spy
MKRATTIAAALGIALGTALAATASYAHPGYGPGWGMGGGPGSGHGQMMGYGRGMGYGPGPAWGGGPGAGGNPAAFVDSRLAGLKAELGITPAQEGAWNAYAEQAKQQADAMQKWRATMQGSAPATLPERLELRDQMHKQRQAQAETMTQKIKDLYAALTPEHKAIADQRLGGFGIAMRGGPGYRHR